MMPTANESELPVLIAGAGPAGLVAALALQEEGVPFVILEKVSREKLNENVGSGYDMSPTTVKIFKDLLGLDTSTVLIEYAGFHIVTLEGKIVKDSKAKEPPSSSKAGNSMMFQQATRAGLQRMLLDNLTLDDKSELRCGLGVESYSEDAAKGVVTVTLSDGSTIQGRALLACDGIHSRVRKCMHGSDEVDPLSYCGTKCYWGVCPKPEPGSRLGEVINQCQQYRETGPSFVMGLSTHRAPGSFFLTPNQGEGVWVLALRADEPTNTSGDLRRRGGGVLTDETKESLLKMLEARPGDFPLMLEVIKGTPPENITEAGLYDRENRDLPYSSPGKLVALLGDSAHPQSPFLGQGCNMAIADGYVCAKHLAKMPVPEAITEYDCDQRREEARDTIVKARQHTDFCVSCNPLACWFMYFLTWCFPLDDERMMEEMVKPDQTNTDMLRRLRGEDTNSPARSSSLSTALVVGVPVMVLAAMYFGRSLK